MSDSPLPRSVVDALLRLHSALPHDAALEGDLYFVRSELAKALTVCHGHEKAIRRLEEVQLKHEGTINYQANRLMLQHAAAVKREQDLDRMRSDHARLLADYNQLNVRAILARIMGRRRVQE